MHYNNAYDAVDDYIRIEKTIAMSEACGFPGMMGSINCMNWKWKNYPKACKYRSPVFDEVLEGHALEVNYTINGNNYNMGYYLTDGKYFEWATFVKTIPRVQGDKRKLFSKYQESLRKDVVTSVWCAIVRFEIVRCPVRFWDKTDLGIVIRACIIIHNMIVENERDTYATQFDHLRTYDDATNGLLKPNLGEEISVQYETYIQKTIQMHDKRAHRHYIFSIL
ncbi:uncharacterized protein LOC141686367 [Apium graveolens]|uniref:uncharacterized protein LOC141686367 n=1 Tax=Apium graveolens TaxID=4045 RepID=UPI003D79568E